MTRWTERDLQAKGLKIIGEPVQRPIPGLMAGVEEGKRKSKYGNRKVERHGRMFDSVAEADRASALILLEKARDIRALAFQPVYLLKAEGGRVIARYRADFAYFEGGRHVVEEIKSKPTITPQASLKLKLFVEQYPNHDLRIVDKAGRRIQWAARYPKVAA